MYYNKYCNKYIILLCSIFLILKGVKKNILLIYNKMGVKELTLNFGKKGLILGGEVMLATIATLALGEYVKKPEYFDWKTLGTVGATTCYVGSYFFKK